MRIVIYEIGKDTHQTFYDGVYDSLFETERMLRIDQEVVKNRRPFVATITSASLRSLESIAERAELFPSLKRSIRNRIRQAVEQTRDADYIACNGLEDEDISDVEIAEAIHDARSSIQKVILALTTAENVAQTRSDLGMPAVRTRAENTAAGRFGIPHLPAMHAA